MNWIHNLSTRAKLFLGAGFLLAMLALAIATAVWSITALEASNRKLVEDEFDTVANISEMRALQDAQRLTMVEHILSAPGPEEVLKLEKILEDTAVRLNQHMAKLKAQSLDQPKLAARIGELETLTGAYRQGRAEQIALLKAGKPEQARSMGVTTQDRKFESIAAIELDLYTAAQEEAKLGVTRAVTLAQTAEKTIVLGGLIACALGLFLALQLGRSIADPLREIANLAERMAAGDLAFEHVALGRQDEVGVLSRSFARLADSLRGQIRNISEGVSVLSAAASEISTSTTQLAATSAETAAAVSETATTVEELRQTAVVASQKARSVSEVSQKAAQVAQIGRKSVDDTVGGMNRIRDQMESIAERMVRLNEQSQSIGQIVTTVEDLAAQSNMLAVNAGIEAAKAGDQGKGFAVVAQEVRRLAEQSKQATAQVMAILSEIQKATNAAMLATEQGGKSVEAGVVQASQAGQSIVQMSANVTEASSAAAQIAATSQQQLVGVDQVASSMEGVKQASAQNADGAKQLELAAHSLKELGERLKQLIAHYKL